jgi:hypothetical protein
LNGSSGHDAEMLPNFALVSLKSRSTVGNAEKYNFVAA